MRRLAFILAVLAIVLVTGPTQPALAQSAELRIYPANKYAALALASYDETGVDTDLAVGQEAANERRGQGFKILVSRAIGGVGLWLKASGAPMDDLTVEIQTDSGGLPSGTPVTNGVSSAVRGGTIYGEAYVDTDLAVGDSSAHRRRAQGFEMLMGSSIAEVRLWLKKSGSPTDSLTVEIQTDSDGVPSGTPVANGVSNAVDGGTLGASYGWVAFDFSVPPDLAAGTQYHVVLKRSVAPDVTKYYLWGADQSSPGYDDGAASVFDASWQATSPATDHAFSVIPASTSYGWVAFDFSSPPQLTAGTQYHVVLKRSGGIDATNYYLWGADQSSPAYGDGVGSMFGGSWQATSPATDHTFQVRPTLTVDVYARDVQTTDPCEPLSSTEPCGLGGYEFEVHFDPTVIRYVSVENGPFLTSTGRLIYLCLSRTWTVDPPHDPDNGRVHYSCSTTGNPPEGGTPLGPEGSGVLGTITFVPVAMGTTSLQYQNLGQSTILVETMAENPPIDLAVEGGSVTVGDYASTDDTDGDGCADIEEVGNDSALGGNRNPLDPWDFFDVSVPARADPAPNGPKSKAISLADVLAALMYVGAYEGGPANGNGLAYDSDKGVDTNGDTVADIPPDGVPDGQAYDRTPAWPFSGAPNGAINLSDVLAVLYQVGHNCVNPP